MPAWLQPLLTVNYWFGSYPAPFTGSAYNLVLGFVVGTFVLGIVIRVAGGMMLKDGSWRRVCMRLGALGMTTGVLAGLSFFFTQTQTPLLGNRFWFLLWLLVGLVWLWFIGRYAVRIAPQERAERLKQAEYEKYLPRAH